MLICTGLTLGAEASDGRGKRQASGAGAIMRRMRGAGCTGSGRENRPDQASVAHTFTG